MSDQDGREQLPGDAGPARVLHLGGVVTRAPRAPYVGADVLYQSYGTPGGEYRPAGRAAKVTEVGGWITTDDTWAGVPGSAPRTPMDGAARSLAQRYTATACTVFVMNPTGVFLTGPLEYHTGRDQAGVFIGFRGGTWHWPEDEPAG